MFKLGNIATYFFLGILAGCSGDGKPFTVQTIPEGWWNSEWESRIKVTINNSAGTEEIPDYPILVNLTSAQIDYARTQDNGQDIRILADDNLTVLPHEIEKWNESGTSTLWTKMTLPAGSQLTFYIYYSNATASAPTTPTTDVWSDSFAAVYHLTSMTNDSSPNGLHGTNTGTVPTSGVAGDSGNFTGTEHIEVAHTPLLTFGINDSFTCELLADAAGPTATFLGVVTKARNTLQWWGLWSSDTNIWVWGAYNGVGAADNIGTTNITTGWKYIVIKNDAVGRTIYIDGAVDATDVSRVTDGVGPLIIGAATPGFENFLGRIDEVRISSTDRSDAYVAAQFKNLNSTWISFSPATNL